MFMKYLRIKNILGSGLPTCRYWAILGGMKKGETRN